MSLRRLCAVDLGPHEGYPEVRYSCFARFGHPGEHYPVADERQILRAQLAAAEQSVARLHSRLADVAATDHHRHAGNPSGWPLEHCKQAECLANCAALGLAGGGESDG